MEASLLKLLNYGKLISMNNVMSIPSSPIKNNMKTLFKVYGLATPTHITSFSKAKSIK